MLIIIILIQAFFVWLMIRAHRVNQEFHHTILLPWREAIEAQDFHTCAIYQARSKIYIEDFYKLVLIPWRKLP